MINQVRLDLLNILASAPILRNANGAGRVFELFIMTGIARTLQLRGYNVWLQRSDGTRILPTHPNPQFIQRGGRPSGIASSGQGPANATVICFETATGNIWEIWNGVQFEGRSGSTHEIDLAIVPHQVGLALRGTVTGGVPVGRPKVSIECKDVKNDGTPDEMRAFIARLYDLTLLAGHQFFLRRGLPQQSIYPNNPPSPNANPQNTYWDENRNTLNILARRSDFSRGAAAMTVYHSVVPYGNISSLPANSTVLKNDIVDWIDNNLP